MTDTTPSTDELLEHLAAVGNKAVNDYWHEDLCMCDDWPKSCVSSGNYFFGTWDTSAFAIALPAIIAAYEEQRAVRGAEAQVAAAYGFADEMADYCSPHNIAADYAKTLRARLDNAATNDEIIDHIKEQQR